MTEKNLKEPGGRMEIYTKKNEYYLITQECPTVGSREYCIIFPEYYTIIQINEWFGKYPVPPCSVEYLLLL